MSVSGFSHVQPGLLQANLAGDDGDQQACCVGRHIFLGLICKFTSPTGPAPPFFFWSDRAMMTPGPPVAYNVVTWIICFRSPGRHPFDTPVRDDTPQKTWVLDDILQETCDFYCTWGQFVGITDVHPKTTGRNGRTSTMGRAIKTMTHTHHVQVVDLQVNSYWCRLPRCLTSTCNRCMARTTNACQPNVSEHVFRLTNAL